MHPFSWFSCGLGGSGHAGPEQLGVGPWPAIGSVDTLVLPGPHGSLAVRRHIPTEATSQPSGALTTQLDEIQYVVRWLFDHAAGEGVDPAKIALGGDSAGGNMTCVLALKLRDTAGPAGPSGPALP